MLLLYGMWALITAADLAQLAPLDELHQTFVCKNEACYSISWTSRKYARAKQDCENNKQHLMTVKSAEQADAISQLISKVKLNDLKVWIGLEPLKGCTDPKLPLRGFNWVTGESYTDSILWNNDEPKCAEHGGDLCVTVNNNGTWEETDCTSKPNGLLCESSHATFCHPLNLPNNYQVIYVHPQHGIGLSLNDMYPEGTIGFLPSDQERLLCEEKDGQGKWNRKEPGAWSCEIDHGGCEYQCLVVDGTPKCSCFEGSKLKEDERSCVLLCDHDQCNPASIPLISPYKCPEGYHLAEDGKICVNDNCTTHPNTCGHQCTNESSSFTCDCITGFKKVPFDTENADEWGVKCEAIDACEQAMCEQTCKPLPGGQYMCTCGQGYVPDENNGNKCKRYCNASECEAECNEKTQCNCPEGYILEHTENKAKCIDVDECLDNVCAWSCINLFGHYQCTCPKGYTVHGLDCVPDGTERTGVTIETTSAAPIPQTTYSIEPTVLIGICIGIISMLTVLIAMVCHMLRKHYMDQHDFDYKIRSAEKYVVLQQTLSHQPGAHRESPSSCSKMNSYELRTS